MNDRKEAHGFSSQNFKILEDDSWTRFFFQEDCGDVKIFTNADCAVFVDDMRPYGEIWSLGELRSRKVATIL